MKIETYIRIAFFYILAVLTLKFLGAITFKWLIYLFSPFYITFFLLIIYIIVMLIIAFFYNLFNKK